MAVLVIGSGGMGSIFNNGNTVTFANGMNRVDVTRCASIMDGIMALVREVIAASTASGVTINVSLSTSIITGVAPSNTIIFSVETRSGRG